jgi:hypothetical protein
MKRLFAETLHRAGREPRPAFEDDWFIARCNPHSEMGNIDNRTGTRMNPPASAFPVACRGVSERNENGLFLLRIEDSPRLAAERVKFRTLILGMAVLLFWEFSVPLLPGPAWAATGTLLGEAHKSRGIDCSGCHRESPPKHNVPMATCLECHGDYGKVAVRTNKLDPNPHDSHLGEVDCGKCHHAHKTSVNACNACHRLDMNVP